MGVDEQAAAPELLLAEGMIDGEGRAGHDVLVVDIRGDADDAARLGADVDELHDRVGPHEVAVDGVLIGEHAPRQALADDDDLLAAVAVGVVEVAAGDDRDAERGEEAGRDGAESGARILFSPGPGRGRRRRIETRAEVPASRQGTMVPTARRSTPGQFADAPDGLAVEATICSGVLPYDMTGTFTASTWRVSKPVCAACRASRVLSSMLAPASSTKEAAIWVTAKTRWRRVVPPRDAQAAAGQADPWSYPTEGRRGTKASSTAAMRPAPAPTQSMLEST